MYDGMNHAEFTQQQAMVLRKHKPPVQPVDTTTVLDVLTYLIPRFPQESVVSNALTDALRSIESDIETSMKGH